MQAEEAVKGIILLVEEATLLQEDRSPGVTDHPVTGMMMFVNHPEDGLTLTVLAEFVMQGSMTHLSRGEQTALDQLLTDVRVVVAHLLDKFFHGPAVEILDVGEVFEAEGE